MQMFSDVLNLEDLLRGWNLFRSKLGFGSVLAPDLAANESAGLNQT